MEPSEGGLEAITEKNTGIRRELNVAARKRGSDLGPSPSKSPCSLI